MSIIDPGYMNSINVVPGHYAEKKLRLYKSGVQVKDVVIDKSDGMGIVHLNNGKKVNVDLRLMNEMKRVEDRAADIDLAAEIRKDQERMLSKHIDHVIDVISQINDPKRPITFRYVPRFDIQPSIHESEPDEEDEEMTHLDDMNHFLQGYAQSFIELGDRKNDIDFLCTLACEIVIGYFTQTRLCSMATYRDDLHMIFQEIHDAAVWNEVVE